MFFPLLADLGPIRPFRSIFTVQGCEVPLQVSSKATHYQGPTCKSDRSRRISMLSGSILRAFR